MNIDPQIFQIIMGLVNALGVVGFWAVRQEIKYNREIAKLREDEITRRVEVVEEKCGPCPSLHWVSMKIIQQEWKWVEWSLYRLAEILTPYRDIFSWAQYVEQDAAQDYTVKCINGVTPILKIFGSNFTRPTDPARVTTTPQTIPGLPVVVPTIPGQIWNDTNTANVRLA